MERALAYAISMGGPLVMFIMVYQIKGTLTLPIIFSILEIMTTLKRNLMVFNTGSGFYFELKVVFGRFASVFNTENKSKIEIDPDTHKPINKYEVLSESILINNTASIIEPSSEMACKERSKGSKIDEDVSEPLIRFNSFCGYWKEEFDQPSLKGINYTFVPGKVYGIAGKVGSGKSGLLGAILK